MYKVYSFPKVPSSMTSDLNDVLEENEVSNKLWPSETFTNFIVWVYTLYNEGFKFFSNDSGDFIRKRHRTVSSTLFKEKETSLTTLYEIW